MPALLNKMLTYLSGLRSIRPFASRTFLLKQCTSADAELCCLKICATEQCPGCCRYLAWGTTPLPSRREAPGLLNNPEKLGERVYGLGNPRKARELGNLHPGDGYRYRGGGLMQTTGGGAYQHMGEKAGVDFYGDPNLIVAPEYAIKPAVYEWQEGNLNDDADRNDIRTITRKINGGYNGLAGRQALFYEIWPIANKNDNTPPAWQGADADDQTRWLQEALNDLGAEPPILVDGKYGPATTEAVNVVSTISFTADRWCGG